MAAGFWAPAPVAAETTNATKKRIESHRVPRPGVGGRGCRYFLARSTERDVYTAASGGFSLYLLVLKGSFFTHTNAEPGMKRSRAIFTSVSTLALVAAAAAWVKPTSFGMVTGPIAAKSLGAITFGPGNVLFAADNDAESVYAIEITDASKASGPIDMAGIDSKIAQALGTTVDQVSIADMAVHPTSHNVYVTVTRGKGVDAKPALLRVTSDAKQPISVVSLDEIKHSVAKIDNAPASTGAGGRDPHRSTITDLAFTDGNLWIAGLSNEQFSSAFRRMPFPFTNKEETTTLQIYHVSHRRSETQAPVMTFTPTKINGTLYMLAAYTCTPIVAFDASSLKNGQAVTGRTVAELGAGNQPADIISYTLNGKGYVLVANRTHPMMKLSSDEIAGAPALTTPDNEGIARTKVSAPGAIVQLADFDANNVIVIQKGASGGFDLKTIAKSSF